LRSELELIDFNILVIENTYAKNQQSVNLFNKSLRDRNVLNRKSNIQLKNKMYNLAFFSAIIVITIFRLVTLRA